jgi:hypothetical protein
LERHDADAPDPDCTCCGHDFFAATAHAETGVTDTAILIGQSAAFSGPAQELGLEMRQGAKLVFDSVNAQGGIHGRKIQLIAHDDGYEPERAAANTRKLINEDRVFALIGYVGTPTSQSALPIFTEVKVPFIGAFTGAQLLREPFNRYIFNVRASYFDETEKIVEQLVSLGAQTIAVFYQNDAIWQGRPGRSGTRPRQAQHEDGRHRGAQYRRCRRRGEDHSPDPARCRRDGQRLQIRRSVRQGDEKGRQRGPVPQRVLRR